MDFEKAVWRAVQRVLPGVERKGCVFHFTQAIWRHIQECGLQKAYTNDDGTFKFLRKVMSLCFLPSQHIPAIFLSLQNEIDQHENDPLMALLRYVERTWVQSSVWPPSAWSVYFLSVRTNNDLEGWHNRLNSRGKAQMNLYLLVALLHNEAQLIPIQVRLVSERKLKKFQKKKYSKLQKKIFTYWEEYE